MHIHIFRSFGGPNIHIVKYYCLFLTLNVTFVSYNLLRQIYSLQTFSFDITKSTDNRTISKWLFSVWGWEGSLETDSVSVQCRQLFILDPTVYHWDKGIKLWANCRASSFNPSSWKASCLLMLPPQTPRIEESAGENRLTNSRSFLQISQGPEPLREMAPDMTFLTEYQWPFQSITWLLSSVFEGLDYVSS